jgi:hypothetical protein
MVIEISSDIYENSTSYPDIRRIREEWHGVMFEDGRMVRQTMTPTKAADSCVDSELTAWRVVQLEVLAHCLELSHSLPSRQDVNQCLFFLPGLVLPLITS